MIHRSPAPCDVLVASRTLANPRAAPAVFHNSPDEHDLSRTATCPGWPRGCFRVLEEWQGPVLGVLQAVWLQGTAGRDVTGRVGHPAQWQRVGVAGRLMASDGLI